MAEPSPPKKYPWPIRVVMARQRLVFSMLTGAAVALLPAPFAAQAITRALVGWNVGACLYLALAMHVMFWSTHERMRTRAIDEDEGRWVVLVLVIVAALAGLGAIVAELAVAKGLSGLASYAHTALAVLTILSSWIFTHLMFALHYAHDYYAAEVRAHPVGLEFPGGHLPDYGDFLYFSFTIGTSTQTADVNLTSRNMRRTVLVHSVLGFFYNTALLALTINLAAGLA